MGRQASLEVVFDRDDSPWEDDEDGQEEGK